MTRAGCRVGPGSAHDRVEAAAAFLKRKGVAHADAAVVLGSGLSSFSQAVRERSVVPCSDIPGFPVPAVSGHGGEVVSGVVAGKRVVVCSGRVHYYEGYTHDEVTFAVRLLQTLGAPMLVITNAAGGLDPGFDIGDLMVIVDQISVVTGPRRPTVGGISRMGGLYSPRLRTLARVAAREARLPLREGVYLGSTGPTYETPAEIGTARMLGAHAVGMSTVAEVLAASSAGIEVLGISLITNVPLPGGSDATTHAEVLEAGEAGARMLLSLVSGVLDRL